MPRGQIRWPWCLWQSGRPLVCDATCPNTFAVIYRGPENTEAGCVATHAGGEKVRKVLSPGTPLPLSTSGDGDFRGDWPNITVFFEISGESSGSTIWQAESF